MGASIQSTAGVRPTGGDYGASDEAANACSSESFLGGLVSVIERE
jgi:hypothetical protein